jgi:ubiquinone/menaquinone biosynthesis C-methylase UbiE
VTDSDHVASARAVFDAAASKYVEFAGTQINSATEAVIDRSLLIAFVELIRGGPAGAIADIGCGPGRVAAFLARHGLDVVGVDVSSEMLAFARNAHPHIRFELGELAALPIETAVLSGAVCWYSIICTPPDQLGQAFDELRRVLIPEGYVLLGFQSGSGEPRHRPQAHGTEFPLTYYLHSVQTVATELEQAQFTIHTTVERAPHLDHETTPQGFVIARRAAITSA